tara:strand:+ start:4839 stop:5798 length:960 start_codon:yes stop_codon:yes gene_type:complete
MKYVNDLNTNINCEEVVIPAAGTVAAILYHRMRYWCRTNRDTNNTKYKEDERWWLWDSYGSIQKCYPYYSVMQIRTAIKKLLDVGLLLTKPSKNFKNSNKYSAVEIEEWLISKKYNNLAAEKRNQISDIVQKRNLNLHYVKNNKGYVKNNKGYVKNNKPIYIIDTIIRHIKEGAPENSDDLSHEEALKIEYEGLLISEKKLEILLDHFADHVKHMSTVYTDIDKLVNKLYRSEKNGKSYPFWIRLLYGERKNLINSDIRDAIASRVSAEIELNPYIMNVLHNKLPAFDWTEMGIDPISHMSAWTKIENKVTSMLNHVKS